MTTPTQKVLDISVNLENIEEKAKELSIEEKLIDAVKKQTVIYDTSHEDYKNFKKKNDIWAKIAKAAGLTDGSAAKEKWKNLKDSFTRRLREEEKESRSGSARKRKKTEWPFMQHMLFIKDFVSSKENTSSNIQPPDSPTGDNLPTDNDKQDSPSFNNENETTVAALPRPSPRPGSKTKSPLSELDTQIVNFLKANQSKPNSTETDPLKIYFLSCYTTVSKMKKENQLKVKKELNSLISDIEYEEMFE